MKIKEYSREIGGKTVTAQFTDLADQANGSVILKSENTVVMATAVMGKDARNNPGWFNLTVDYLEKHYATGQILGSRFMRREGRPTEEAILSSRFIDRTIRPLFEHHIKNPVQVIVSVLSIGDTDPGILGINAASMALATSDIPWNGPIGAVHVGKKKGDGDNISVDLYLRQYEATEDDYALDLTVCGKDGNINMLEGMSHESPEAEIGTAFDLAVTEITKWEEWQKEIVAEIGKEKLVMAKTETPESVRAFFDTHCRETAWSKLMEGCSKYEIYAIENEWRERIAEEYAEDEDIQGIAHDYFSHAIDEMIHTLALEHDKRADGRAMDTVRSLYAQAGGVSPVLHGSGIFYRGETHVFSALTLGGPDDTLIEDGMEVQGEKRFMHHYNFPPYSAGETGRVGGLNRRETGHGALAEKALLPVIPSKESFPYTIRLVSESTASNGSTSQASICASTVALMDGGVPITRPVAGIAMGAMIAEDSSEKYKILTDIQGPEDHHGDMDFKVAGTREGVTAIQLDIKVDGIPVKILKEALEDAKKARVQILDVIEAEIPKPRAEIASSAPKILAMNIDVSQIGMVIGKGGETIQKLQEETGANISIEDDGTIFATGTDGSAEKAIEAIMEMTKEWREGDRIEGEVVKIIEGVGAIVKISPYADGLVHISEIANFRVNNVEDYLKPGMTVPVVVTQVDKAKGRIGLSIKKADGDFIQEKK
jgi:polyribonucleotide nucleotidyltransferase